MVRTVFDMGAHQGEDTEYFLKRGFQVVAFECNPRLVSSLADRFSSEIRAGQLKLVSKAIAPVPGKVRFYVHELSVWGTISPDWSERNQRYLRSAPPAVVEVDAITPADCFAIYGTPYYLKIDVEGMDHAILEALLQSDVRPEYVSIESEKVRWKGLLREFEIFGQLGYNKFNVVDQRWNRFKTTKWAGEDGGYARYRHARHSSGPACEDLRRGWMSRERAIAKYRLIFLHYKLLGDSGLLSPLKRLPLIGVLFRLLGASWYDTHATRLSDDT